MAVASGVVLVVQGEMSDPLAGSPQVVTRPAGTCAKSWQRDAVKSGTASLGIEDVRELNDLNGKLAPGEYTRGRGGRSSIYPVPVYSRMGK